jgi:hypothetical protein
VYKAIAQRAVSDSLKTDKSDDLGNIVEWFRRHCATARIPYDGDISRRACEAAVVAREQARARLAASMRKATA